MPPGRFCHTSLSWALQQLRLRPAWSEFEALGWTPSLAAHSVNTGSWLQQSQRHPRRQAGVSWHKLSLAVPCASRCSENISSFSFLRASLCGFAAGLVLVAEGLRRRGHVRCDETEEWEEVRLTPRDLEPLLEPSKDNPIPVSLPPPMPGLTGHQWARYRHVAPIFGLPMRGKTYLAHELKRYIKFFHGARSHVFDLNKYLGKDGDDELYADLIRFFEATDTEALDMTDVMDNTKANYSGGFAIITTSDTVEALGSKWSSHTKFNRRWMSKTLENQLGAQMCFIQVTVEPSGESQKFMEQLAHRRGKNLCDLEMMIDEYNDHYVPIQMDGSEGKTPFIQLINYNEAMIVNRMMQTFVGSRVCQFLSNTHPYQHTIFLSRHGESLYNTEKRLGGNSSLSLRGQEFARRTGEFSKFVVSGNCTNLVCVTLSRKELQSLHEHVTSVQVTSGLPGGRHGVHAVGDWTSYGDASGAAVVDGMRLVRLQPGYRADFVDAPTNLDEVLRICGKGSATLVFVEGDIQSAGQVPARLWTSSLNRTIETAAFIQQGIVIPGPGNKPWHQMTRRTYRNLDEVYAGVYDGYTEKEIELVDPQLIKDRKRDKLGFRYPRGESYYDIIARLDDVMTNLERVREPILIVSHQAVLRLILAWLTEADREDALGLTFPQHAVMRVSFDGVSARKFTSFMLGPGKISADGQENL